LVDRRQTHLEHETTDTMAPNRRQMRRTNRAAKRLASA
jgi:hypothetical protein